MPRRNSAKSLSPGRKGEEKMEPDVEIQPETDADNKAFSDDSTMVIEVEPQLPPSTSQDADDSKSKRSLEALFQAAKSELQHIEGQGGEESHTVSVVEIGPASDIEGVVPSYSIISQAPTIVQAQPSQAMVYDMGHEHQVVAIDIPTPSPKVSTAPVTPYNPDAPQVGRKRKHPAKPGKYICNYCGRGCAKPSVLEKHIRAHTGERPYPCKPCGFAFKTKSNLYKHCKSRAHQLKVEGLKGVDVQPGQFTSVDEDDEDVKDANDNVSMDSEGTANVSGNTAIEEISADQVEVIGEEDEDEDEEGSEAITEITPFGGEEPGRVDQMEVEPVTSTPVKREMKYYIVEVKDGESLEEVVQRANMAAKQKDLQVTPSSEDMETVLKQGKINMVSKEAGKVLSTQVGFKPAADTFIQDGKIVMQRPKVKVVSKSPGTEFIPSADSDQAQPLVLRPSKQVTMVITPGHGLVTGMESGAVTKEQDDLEVVGDEVVIESDSEDIKRVEAETVNVIEPENNEKDMNSSVTSSVERVNDKTVKVQIQLVPSIKPNLQETPQPPPKKLVKLQTARQGQILQSDSAPETPSRLSNKNLTPEMVQARISELINMNQVIVNTPMADAPRPKRMPRQQSLGQRGQSMASAGSTPQLFVQSEDGKIHPLVTTNVTYGGSITTPVTPLPSAKLMPPSVVITPKSGRPTEEPFLLPAPGVQQHQPAGGVLQHPGLSVMGGGAEMAGAGELDKQQGNILTISLKQASPQDQQPQLQQQQLPHPANPEGSVIKELLLKPRAPGIQPALSQPASEEGVHYLCTACSLLFPSKDSMIMHAKFQCPANKPQAPSSESEQTEAVRTLIGQELQPEQPEQTPTTPLYMDMVDPGTPLKRGRPKKKKVPTATLR